jgi:hypothetical protein
MHIARNISSDYTGFVIFLSSFSNSSTNEKLQWQMKCCGTTKFIIGDSKEL